MALKEVSTQRPRDWCSENIYFDEPNNRGPFRLAGREYVADILDDWADQQISDEVLVMGTQSGKTAAIMAGAAWAAVNDPCRTMWAMPSLTLAQSFSSTRWQPMLRRSEETAKLIPGGSNRHDFKNLQQRLGGSIFDFVGSNSAANMSSNPCRRFIADEVDKFDTQGGEGEANALNLGEQRTKGQTNPQRWKTSSPTLVDGLIWQEYLKGNQCRYDVPCPSCRKMLLLAWSAQYTILKKTGREAYVIWDAQGKRSNGLWDLDRVHRSARFKCPFCQVDIEDSKKTWMVRDGVWVPTNPGASKGFISRHLSSLYACTPETSCGALAIKFLNQKNSLLGLQGFINGDLAEPFMAQDTQGKRIERIVEKITIQDNSTVLLTADCQQKGPYYWYTAARWSPNGMTVIDAGSLDTIEQLREKQIEHKVSDVGVMIDSGFGARSDAEVYRNCARFGEINEECDPPTHCGWMPAKGQPTRKRWKDENDDEVPYFLRNIDPYFGTDKAGQIEMSLFEFSGEFYKDILQAMREGKGPYSFEVLSEVADDTFWQHMDSEIKVPVVNKIGRTIHEWRLRSKHWPNHLFDCIVMQVALANFFELLKIE